MYNNCYSLARVWAACELSKIIYLPLGGLGYCIVTWKNA